MTTEHLSCGNDSNDSIGPEEEFCGDAADMERWLKAKQTFTKLQDGLAELEALGLRYELHAHKGMTKKRKRESLRLSKRHQ
jgi:hypothetical protein